MTTLVRWLAASLLLVGCSSAALAPPSYPVLSTPYDRNLWELNYQECTAKHGTLIVNANGWACLVESDRDTK